MWRCQYRRPNIEECKLLSGLLFGHRRRKVYTDQNWLTRYQNTSDLTWKEFDKLQLNNEHKYINTDSAVSDIMYWGQYEYRKMVKCHWTLWQNILRVECVIYIFVVLHSLAPNDTTDIIIYQIMFVRTVLSEHLYLCNWTAVVFIYLYIFIITTGGQTEQVCWHFAQHQHICAQRLTEWLELFNKYLHLRRFYYFTTSGGLKSWIFSI